MPASPSAVFPEPLAGGTESAAPFADRPEAETGLGETFGEVPLAGTDRTGAYGPVIDALHWAGERIAQLPFENPDRLPEIAEPGQLSRGEAIDRIWAAVGRQRKRDPDFLREIGTSREDFERPGGAAASLPDPVGIAAPPLAGTGRTVVGSMAQAGVEAMIRQAAGAGDDLSALFGAMPESVQRRWAAAATFDDVPLTDILRQVRPPDSWDLDTKAAVHVLEREDELSAASPFVRGPDGDDAHGLRLAAAMQRLTDRVPGIALTVGRFLQTDPIGDQSNLHAGAGDDPVNRTDLTGPAADDDLARARRTLSTLMAGIRSDMAASNQPEAGSRTRSGPGNARAAGLRIQLRALNARTVESMARMRVAPPSAAIGAGITDAMRGSRAETIYTARGSNGSVAYGQAARRSRTSDSGQATTETENLLATGHRHDDTAGNEYPGIGDPGNTLRFGVPTIYSYGDNSNAIGWNGSRFTLTNIRGTLPSYQLAPDWIRETFEPW